MAKRSNSRSSRSELGFADLSVKSTDSQYQQTNIGRFTSSPGVVSQNDFDLGECLVDSVAIMVVCGSHGTVALTTIPGKGYWFPMRAIAARQSFDEAVGDLLQQILPSSQAQPTRSFSKPYPIDHLRLQVPRLFNFVERVLFYVEATYEHSTAAECCPSSQVVKWFRFEDALNLVDLWGNEPELFIGVTARHLPLPPCNLTEVTIRKVLACLAESSPQAQMLAICGLDEKVITQLYGEFAQHCFPSQAMNIVSFVDYLTRSDVVQELGYQVMQAFFRSFALDDPHKLNFREFILGLAAVDSKCPHGGKIGLLRVAYISRYYNTGPNEEVLDFNSIRWFARDLIVWRESHQGGEPSEEQLEQEVAKCYAVFGLENTAPVPSSVFCHAIGRLRIRGTSRMFRCDPSPLEILKSKTLYSNMEQCQLANEKVLCFQCRSKQYTLAAHIVTLAQSGQVVEPLELKLCPDVRRMSQAARKRSDQAFDEPYFCNELIDTIRQLNKKPESSPWFSPKSRLSMVPKILQLCEETKAVFSKEARVVKVNSPCYVIGDIHGNLNDLLIFEKLLWKTRPNCLSANYLFLGDYVDRGDNSVECITYLLCFKLLAPNRFTLLRGNHEVRPVQHQFTFYRECVDKFDKDGQKVWEAFNRVFDTLPLCATIDDQIFCAHGGIPASVSKMAHLNAAIPCPMDDPETQSPAGHEVLWNDPVTRKDFDFGVQSLKSQGYTLRYPPGFIPNTKRGTAFFFSDAAVDIFLATNRFSHVIRAHEVIPDGYHLHSGGRVITIFSCSNYCAMLNTAAVVLVDGNKIRIMKVDTQH